MKRDARPEVEIEKDLDSEAEEVIRAAEGPSGLTNGVGMQNPFKSAEQALDSAPPEKNAADGFENGSIFGGNPIY